MISLSLNLDGGIMRRGLGAVICLAFCLLGATVALHSPACSQSIDGTNLPAIVEAHGGNPSHYILLAQAGPTPPHWRFQRSTTSTDLRRNKARPPAFIAFSFRMIPPERWIVTWTNNVQASGQRLTQEIARSNEETFVFFRIDPCKVTGLDTPGTEIPVTYEFVFLATQSQGTSDSQPAGAWEPPFGKGSFILKLDRDTRPPLISSVNAPNLVSPDETVQIAVSATDDSDEMGGDPVWDSGLRLFRLEGPSNPGSSGLQAHGVDDSVPQTCSEKVKKANHSFSYTVPHNAQPGDIITLNVEAEDWSGNRAAKPVVLKVRERRDDRDAGAPSRDSGGRQRDRCTTERKIVRGRDFTWFCP